MAWGLGGEGGEGGRGLTIVLQGHVLQGFIHAEVEADIRDDADDTRQPAPPKCNHAFLQRRSTT